MVSEQFDEFWELRCPKCNKPIDLEILINYYRNKLGKVEELKK